MIGRIEVKPHNIAQFLGKLLVIGELELTHPMRLKTMLAPDARCTEETLTPISFAIASAVQWVVSPSGGFSVAATIWAATSSLRGALDASFCEAAPRCLRS